METSWKTWTLAGCFCTGIILLCILLFGGIRFIGFDEYGIVYYTITQQPDEEIITQGTHWLSIDSEVYRYSKIIIEQRFNNLNCLSSDGIKIVINVKLYYQYKQEELLDIFWEYGEASKIENYIKLTAHSGIQDTCSKFIATDFPNKRSEVQSNLEWDLANRFARSKTHSTVNSVQLENYSFPDELNDAIDQKQIALQDKEKAENERQGQLTIAETQKKIADIEAEKIIIKGRAEAESIILESNTTATAITQKLTARALTFLQIKNELQMNTTEFVQGYLKGFVIKESEGTKYEI